MFKKSEVIGDITSSSSTLTCHAGKQTSFLSKSLEYGDMLPPEVEEGCIEYKLKLIDPTPERLQHLVTQLKWRLAEGSGEAIYEIGVSDDGTLVGLCQEEMDTSLSTLKKMGATLNADMSIARKQYVGKNRCVVEVLFKKALFDDHHFLEIRVAILGGLDAGKSSLLGVLTHSENDNGRGKSRLNLLRHPHEIESGRTSSVSHQIVGFDAQGKLINYASSNISTWNQICELSTKIVAFLDMCGHPKYQKTTISGLIGTAFDYSCLIVNSNASGLPDVAREHIGISVLLNIPVFVVMTKIDVASPNHLICTIQSLLALLKSPGVCKTPLIVQTKNDLVACVPNFVSARTVPIFLTSSVTGDNLDLLIEFLNILPRPPCSFEQYLNNEAEYQIEKVYSIPGVGCVVAGIMVSGRMHLSGSKPISCYLGPDRGKYIPVYVCSLHRQKCAVKHVQAGQIATCALLFQSSSLPASSAQTHVNKPNLCSFEIPETQSRIKHQNTITQPSANSWIDTPPAGFKLRRGQILVTTASFATLPESYWEFEVDMHVLYHSTCLTYGSQGTMYCGVLRQSAKVVDICPASPVICTNGILSSAPTSRAPTSSEFSAASQDDESIHSNHHGSHPASWDTNQASAIVPTFNSDNTSDNTNNATMTSSPSPTWSEWTDAMGGQVSAAWAQPTNLPLCKPKNRRNTSCSSRGSDGHTPLCVSTLTLNDITAPASIQKQHANARLFGINLKTDHAGVDTCNTFCTAGMPFQRGKRSSKTRRDSIVNLTNTVTSRLVTGDRGRVRFRFLHEPEWLVPGRTVFFCGTNRMKCVGKIIAVS
ncbi:hypothetical protein BATDEDRAFT_33882 [Batrachochytrium dendrobatidis JAM81]|uniref:Tr-type G domain-containing protein n=1 Tax=Batrachochytrium dendrobatidis (strain JAM81 / FGSC 10211) TaxID=684364 RepID=F4NRK7_BATDJ|nr:uncharacterized protein BATDEDRAFT_33882 [Batrachochytrium dendrobatidis JAM81]EGF83747.1 hypothetical protein BATDEDRAFT_33882 [Batrachochytrium dendrobatidis JAM81]|eukprot:XP_006675681.1 hypothetical protein BATDEDRAFT_33882 [Batrachochytrium dendrobatidis JAM81]